MLIGMLVGQIMVQAAILALILRLIAKHEADYGFAKVAMVTAAITVGSFFVKLTLFKHIGAWSNLAVIFFIAFMLMTFCWVSFWKSLVVVTVYIATQVGFSFLLILILGAVFGTRVSWTPEKAHQESTRLPGDEGVDVTANESASVDRATERPAKEEEEGSSLLKTLLSRNAKPKAGPSAADWQGARKKVKISGTMKGVDRLGAMINNRIVMPGETVSVDHAGLRYRWRLADIEGSRVELVPLRTDPIP